MQAEVLSQAVTLGPSVRRARTHWMDGKPGLAFRAALSPRRLICLPRRLARMFSSNGDLAPTMAIFTAGPVGTLIEFRCRMVIHVAHPPPAMIFRWFRIQRLTRLSSAQLFFISLSCPIFV